MRIKKRLQLNVAISVIAAVVICLMLFLALQRITNVSSLTKTAGDLMAGILDRVVLGNDYIRNDNPRAKEQWFAKHEQVGAILKRAVTSFRDAEDRKNISDMIEDHQAIGRIFSAIVANRENPHMGTYQNGLSREVEERLLNQLNIRVYEVTIQINKLLESARMARSSVFRETGREIISLLVLLIATAMFNSWATARAITARVDRLREGAAVIGGGDLEHRIDIKGDDEFAELAESFNAMTAKLRSSYRDLESEIEVRKRAEEDVKSLLSTVQEEKERLSCLVNGISDEVWFADTNRKFTLANPSAIREFSLGSPHGGDVATLAASLEVYRGDGSLRPVEEAPPLRALTGEIIRNEEEIIRTPGTSEMRHRQVSSAPVRNAAGKIIGSVSVVRDITERKLAEEALQEAYDELAKLVEERTRELREKEVLLKEVHHRVKNNLQVISSLVSLQADGSTDELVRGVLKDVTDRVRSMALVHEKLYQSADLARIDFAEYARSLLGYLWRAHGSAAAPVRLTLDMEPVSLPVDTAVPCGLILNELAGNALKHAFRGRSEGEVTVSLQSGEDGRIRLSVADNGVGLPTGFGWREARSLGLRLVLMLAGQLGAEVEVGSEEGTRFEIAFGNPGSDF